MHNKFISLLILVSLSMLISCGEKKQQRSEVVHPVEESIPHSDVASDQLEARNAADILSELPRNVQLLYKFLNDETSQFNTVELNILTTNRIDILTLGDSGFLILEKDQNRLIQYDLTNDDFNIIAEQGRGPGDLFFSKELSVYNGKAFIGMQGRQLSVFNCESTLCEYEKTMNTDYNNYSLAVTDNHLYFLGIPQIRGGQSSSTGSSAQFIVHKADRDARIERSFLPNYDHESPILRDRIMSRGSIRAFADYDKTIVTFDHFPYLFTYDHNGELISKLELSDFIPAKNIEYNSANRGILNTYNGDYTYLQYTSKLQGRWLLKRIAEFRNVEYSMENGITGEMWYSYYIFDVEDEKLYKIGDDRSTSFGESRRLFLVDGGVISSKNGTLHWIWD
jgi:hypothetical protein